MERIWGMMFAQAANPSSTKVLPIEAASCSEAAVTKMIKNPRATVSLNQDKVLMNPSEADKAVLCKSAKGRSLANYIFYVIMQLLLMYAKKKIKTTIRGGTCQGELV